MRLFTDEKEIMKTLKAKIPVSKQEEALSIIKG
jgi:hypothetical protein